MQQNKDKSGEITTLIALAKTNAKLGKFIKSIEYNQQALNKTDNKAQKEVILGNLAIAYKELGNYIKAVEINKQLLQNFPKVSKSKNKIKVLNNLGNVYEALGD